MKRVLSMLLLLLCACGRVEDSSAVRLPAEEIARIEVSGSWGYPELFPDSKSSEAELRIYNGTDHFVTTVGVRFLVDQQLDRVIEVPVALKPRTASTARIETGHSKRGDQEWKAYMASAVSWTGSSLSVPPTTVLWPMGFWEFLAQFVAAVAWPATVLVVVCWLRTPLARLLSRLATFKYGDFELRFAEKLANVEAVVSELPPAPLREHAPSPPPEAQARSAMLHELAAASPAGAVLLAWREVEQAVRERASARGIELSAPAMRGKQLLRWQFLQSDHEARAYDELRAMRNSVAHGPALALQQEDAERYVALAEQLVEWLRVQP